MSGIALLHFHRRYAFVSFHGMTLTFFHVISFQFLFPFESLYPCKCLTHQLWITFLFRFFFFFQPTHLSTLYSSWRSFFFPRLRDFLRMNPPLASRDNIPWYYSRCYGCRRVFKSDVAVKSRAESTVISLILQPFVVKTNVLFLFKRQHLDIGQSRDEIRGHGGEYVPGTLPW